MQVRKSEGLFEFDFTFGGRRIRQSVECGAFVRFLDGEEFTQREANLGVGKEAVSVYDFIYEYYLPLQSQPNKKPSAYKTDRSTMKSIARYFGDLMLHQVQVTDWEEYKRIRLSAGAVPIRCKRLEEKTRRGEVPPLVARAAATINRELSGLKQVLEFALGLGFIRQNPIANRRRLPPASRKQQWLRRPEIDHLLGSIPLGPDGAAAGPVVFRDLTEFLVLTGARIGEALLFNARQVDLVRQEIEIITFKM